MTGDANRPLRDDGTLEEKFIGVQKRSDGLYFFYPNAGADSFFSTAEDVVFTGYAVRVSRPLNVNDVI